MCPASSKVSRFFNQRRILRALMGNPIILAMSRHAVAANGAPLLVNPPMRIPRLSK